MNWAKKIVFLQKPQKGLIPTHCSDRFAAIDMPLQALQK